MNFTCYKCKNEVSMFNGKRVDEPKHTLGQVLVCADDCKAATSPKIKLGELTEYFKT